MKNKNQPKIINIMPHGPAYGFSPDEKPDSRRWLVRFLDARTTDLLGEAVL